MNWIVLQYRQSEVLVSFILGAEWNCLAIKQQALRFQVKTRIGQEPSAESVKVEDRRKSLQQRKEELCKVRCFLHLLTRCFFALFFHSLPVWLPVASSFLYQLDVTKVVILSLFLKSMISSPGAGKQRQS